MRVTVLHIPAGGASDSLWVGRRSVAGFSLLEVVIAAALLLLTVTVVTACVTVVSRSGQRHESAMAADRALASVASRLRSLPFCAAELPAPAAVCGSGATDLVSAVFPHANAWGGSADDRFVAVGEDGLPAGSFVTSLGAEGVTVVCVARFRGPSGGWLGPDDLGGFDVTSAAEVPAAVLALDLTATTSSGSRSYCLECRAGASADLDPGEDPA